MKKIKKILPENTDITTYFQYKNSIFSKMNIPDGRVLVEIVHCWDDGELMNFGFQYSDGINRNGINPLRIVRLYDKQPSKRTLNRDLKNFYDKYHHINVYAQDCCAG